MPFDVILKPVESLVYRSDVVAIGTFRCPATHPLFRDSGPCSHHTFVFPRTSTEICHDGGVPFSATPNCVTLYNESQEYTRAPISRIDASDWYVVSNDILFAATGRDRRPFRDTHVPIDSSTYLRQRRLFELIVSHSIDSLEVDEAVISLLARVLRSEKRQVVTPLLRGKVEAVKRAIAEAPARKASLRQLAAEADCSLFHLCRSFRNVTGMSITAYRHGLRLRLALALLRGCSRDLSDVALRLGYASHSHFTLAFRRHFGITPSQFRARS